VSERHSGDTAEQYQGHEITTVSNSLTHTFDTSTHTASAQTDSKSYLITSAYYRRVPTSPKRIRVLSLAN